MVEAQRADLGGEFRARPPSSTNELRRQGAGRRARSSTRRTPGLNSSDGQPDRFGAEAVQTLLKRGRATTATG
ncbi:hypothetical protein GCM10020220_091430 [Nonomuraea rubra]